MRIRFLEKRVEITPFRSLAVAAVSAGYHHRSPVVENMTLSVNKGDFLALLGPNGSGKSTLVKTMTGELRPLHGTVLLNEEPLDHYAPRKRARQVAYAPQTSTGAYGTTVRDLMGFARYPFGSPFRRLNKKDVEAIESAAKRCGVEHILDSLVEELSGGQRQKALLAAVVAQETEVLIVDEPTTFLDIRAQQEILGVLKGLHDEGKTVVAVVHDFNHAVKYATRAVVMSKGRLMADGTPGSVLNEKLIKDVFGVSPRFAGDGGKNFIYDADQYDGGTDS